MKNKQTLYQWLTTNFVVDVRDEENFSLKSSFSLNYAKLLVGGVVLFVLLTSLNFYTFKVIDDFTSDEARKEKAFNEKLVQLAASIDSLEREISLKDSFILDVKRIMSGEPIKKNYNDSSAKEPVSSIKGKAEKFSESLSEAEFALRSEFEKTQLTSSASFVKLQGSLSDIFFFAPTDRGMVSKSFDPQNNHLGIDIVAKENEPIKAVADGSVVYAGWSYDTGYMLVIQHHKELISVYKHNAALMKKVGETVKAGEVVAIMGNSGELTSGPHLHFELWLNGNPLNPLDYIVF